MKRIFGFSFGIDPKVSEGNHAKQEILANAKVFDVIFIYGNI
jgi:hypothetical protein